MMEERGAAETYVRQLRLSDLLREPVMRRAAEAFGPPPGSRGLDAACGIGSHCQLLTEAAAPHGCVIGLDRSRDLLGYAAGATGGSVANHVSWVCGDIGALPFRDDSFDWAWSVDCVGYAGEEQLPLLRELARVVKPGGSLAVLVWSSQQLLPGYAELEARLNATSQGIAPFRRGMEPEAHFLRTLSRLTEAGLERPRAQTYIGDVHAPLARDMRDALLSLIEMRWAESQSGLSPEDRAEFRQLCHPDSSAFILDAPGYYAFFTYSMFLATVP
jgi:ubiquinone/menaquinone biosynthesis C-methylase UbiE